MQKGARRCTEVPEVHRGEQRCMVVHSGVQGGARKRMHGGARWCLGMQGGVHRDVHSCARRCTVVHSGAGGLRQCAVVHGGA